MLQQEQFILAILDNNAQRVEQLIDMESPTINKAIFKKLQEKNVTLRQLGTKYDLYMEIACDHSSETIIRLLNAHKFYLTLHNIEQLYRRDPSNFSVWMERNPDWYTPQTLTTLIKAFSLINGYHGHSDTEQSAYFAEYLLCGIEFQPQIVDFLTKELIDSLHPNIISARMKHSQKKISKPIYDSMKYLNENTFKNDETFKNIFEIVAIKYNTQYLKPLFSKVTKPLSQDETNKIKELESKVRMLEKNMEHLLNDKQDNQETNSTFLLSKY